MQKNALTAGDQNALAAIENDLALFLARHNFCLAESMQLK